MNKKLAPSILSADFANLKKDITESVEGGAEYIHFDVMDGQFVPNISIGIPVLKSVRKITDAIIDAHLMIVKPIDYVDAFIKAGADIVTVHLEADKPENILKAIEKIKEQGKTAGISINPKTPVELVFPMLHYVDMVLIMTVEPGFGGQGFIDYTMDKIKAVRTYIDENELSCDVEIDGGIKLNNINECARAGADIIVAGSAVYGSEDIKATTEQLIAEMNRD